MSKVYSDVVKEVVSYKVKECTGIECDICGKVIDGEPRGYKDDDRVYYEVTTSHHDWGNESIESIVHRDICPDCLIGFVDLDRDGRTYPGYYMKCVGPKSC